MVVEQALLSRLVANMDLHIRSLICLLGVEKPRALSDSTSVLANGERGAGASSFFFYSRSLFFPFSSLVLGLGFLVLGLGFFHLSSFFDRLRTKQQSAVNLTFALLAIRITD